jgi:hypothetical protein
MQKRQEDRHAEKLAPGVLGAQMEMRNSLVAFLLLFSLLFFFSIL